MSKTFQARHLDVAAFTLARGHLSGRDPLQDYKRRVPALNAPTPGMAVNWSVRGEQRPDAGGTQRPALHLEVEAELPQTCQRCMGQVMTPVRIDRHLVFVPDEATAAALDEASDDDVLELTPALDLKALVEDEILMALPLVPRHEQCPGSPKLAAQDDAFDVAGPEKPHPFAALAALKDRKPG